MIGCADPPNPPDAPPPPDRPAWSTARHVRWAPLDARTERALVIDLPDGPLDRLLSHPDVATILNDRFDVIFLHPTALPPVTARFGAPSVTALDPDGCVRAAGRPADADAMIALLNEALRARRDGHRAPAPRPGPLPPALPSDGPAADGPWLRCPLDNY